MKILGHRGSGQGQGENTLASIRRAISSPSVAGVEVDVRRTGDGALVLSHEPSIAGRTIIESAYADLAALGVATLADVLEAARGKRVVVEIKNVAWEPDFDPVDQLSVRGVASALSDADDVVVSSFDFSTVEAARDAGLRAALLTMPGMRPMAGIGWASDAGIAEVHPWIGDVLAEPACVAQARDSGLALVTWTASSLDQLEQLESIGVEVAISDVFRD